MNQITKGPWTLKREKMRKLPAVHVMAGDTYLCSVHEIDKQGDELANANLFAAARDMYEAIVIGLTGKDLDGKIIDQKEAVQRLQRAKDKAEGKL